MADETPDDRDAVPPPSTSDLQWEEERSASLRSFQVAMSDGTVRDVLAHYWSNENPAGHLNFYTVQPSGRTLIFNAYSAHLWREVRETTPHDVSREIDRISERAMARERGRKAFEAQAQSSRRVH